MISLDDGDLHALAIAVRNPTVGAGDAYGAIAHAHAAISANWPGDSCHAEQDQGAEVVNATMLAELLADIPGKIDGWRAQARQLTQLLIPARIEGKVSEDLHVSIEQTCSAIYSEIKTCSAITRAVGETSVEAAAELAPINETLRLVLLEVTELSTELYAIGSGNLVPR